MRNLKFFVFGLITAVAAIGFGIAIGQSSVPILGNAQVQISQEIPIVADLLVPIEGGESITTSVPLTMSVDLVVSISGATVTKVEPVAKPALTPAVKVRDAKAVPGMAGIDDLGIPYTLKAPEGLQLDEWKVKLKDDGGLDYEYKISTPGKKFDSNLQANVSYVDTSGTELATGGVIALSAMYGQDRETRSYSGSFECVWNKCAGVLEKAKNYVITFEVELVDFP